ncbi:hypothetical protein MHYP_G00048600 [Metynnis hypsauchen]
MAAVQEASSEWRVGGEQPRPKRDVDLLLGEAGSGNASDKLKIRHLPLRCFRCCHGDVNDFSPVQSTCVFVKTSC